MQVFTHKIWSGPELEKAVAKCYRYINTGKYFSLSDEEISAGIGHFIILLASAEKDEQSGFVPVISPLALKNWIEVLGYLKADMQDDAEDEEKIGLDSIVLTKESLGW